MSSTAWTRLPFLQRLGDTFTTEEVFLLSTTDHILWNEVADRANQLLLEIKRQKELRWIAR